MVDHIKREISKQHPERDISFRILFTGTPYSIQVFTMTQDNTVQIVLYGPSVFTERTLGRDGNWYEAGQVDPWGPSNMAYKQFQVEVPKEGTQIEAVLNVLDDLVIEFFGKG